MCVHFVLETLTDAQACGHILGAKLKRLFSPYLEAMRFIVNGNHKTAWDTESNNTNLQAVHLVDFPKDM